ncbi:putative Actin [Paratrimastix pyriformis]|uniref:Actin n=1 Tax=Paratrimastix pyriformis TaxID=342808 RepID=A0ABQ8UGF3_9EUKA|nr:putative Actin [Paratrimastix pyriformis]
MTEPLQRSVVVDCGSGVCRAGFAGEDFPRTIFPSVVGRHRQLEASLLPASDSRLYIGDEALRNSGLLDLHFPIKRGLVTHWDEMETIWHHTMYTELCVDPNSSPVFVSEAPLTPKQHREHTTTMLFETFAVPSMFSQISAALALYCSGRITGLLVDSGEGITHAVPIYEGYPMPHGVLRMDMGGIDITRFLHKTLEERGVKIPLSLEFDVLRDIKERLCFVSFDYERDIAVNPRTYPGAPAYQMPDGTVIPLERERIMCAELLFRPQLLAPDGPAEGIDRVGLNSIMRCDEDVRTELFRNIVLCGGSTMFRGFPERVTRDIAAHAPPQSQLRVVAPSERKYAAWIGGSIVASLASFRAMWITKAEYDEKPIMQAPSIRSLDALAAEATLALVALARPA